MNSTKTTFIIPNQEESQYFSTLTLYDVRNWLRSNVSRSYPDKLYEGEKWSVDYIQKYDRIVVQIDDEYYDMFYDWLQTR